MLRKSQRSQAQLTEIKGLSHWGWSQLATALGIESHDQITILRITYGTTIAKSMKDSWAGVLQSVRAQARKAYARTLFLAQYNRICTRMFSRENLVSGINSPTQQGARATTHNDWCLVHLARCNLSCTCVHPTSS